MPHSQYYYLNLITWEVSAWNSVDAAMVYLGEFWGGLDELSVDKTLAFLWKP